MYLRVYTAPQPEYDRRIVEMRNEHESFVRKSSGNKPRGRESAKVWSGLIWLITGTITGLL